MAPRYRSGDSGEAYLRQYPALERWMNQCVRCQTRGYKPELPAQIKSQPTFADRNLRRYFAPLALDDLERCAACAEAEDARAG